VIYATHTPLQIHYTSEVFGDEIGKWMDIYMTTLYVFYLKTYKNHSTCNNLVNNLSYSTLMAKIFCKFTCSVQENHPLFLLLMQQLKFYNCMREIYCSDLDTRKFLLHGAHHSIYQAEVVEFADMWTQSLLGASN